jgi:CHAT domain-containing protein/tetratricopeptide (TPR) repeat protein
MERLARINLALLAVIVLFTGAYAFDEVIPGAVVERVTKNLVGDKAGIQEGDVILHWSRGEAKGTVISPFDLSEIEIEQGAQGTLTLEVTRGAETRSCVMERGAWGLITRPNIPEKLLSIYRTGRSLADQGKASDAAEQWREAATQSTQSAWLRAWFLFKAAELFSEAKKWKESDENYLASIEQAKETGPTVMATLLQAWAQTFQQRSDWGNAEKYYLQAITESRRRGAENLSIASILDGLGEVAFGRGDLVKALSYHEQALTIAKKLAPDSLEVARGLNGLGNVSIQRGNPLDAEKYHSEALMIRQRLVPDSVDVARSLCNLGIVEWQRGNLEKAEQYQERALDLLKKTGTESLVSANSLINLAQIKWHRGDLNEAANYYGQALAIAERLAPESRLVAATHTSLGILAADRGDLSSAEREIRGGLAIDQKLSPGSLNVAETISNLGIVIERRGDLITAEDYFRQTLAIERKLAPDSVDTASTFQDLGRVARDRGNLAAAEEYCRLALAIKEKAIPDSLNVADALEDLGVTMRLRGNLEKAEEYHRKALEIERRQAPGGLLIAYTLRSLGDVARDRKDRKMAESYYRQAAAAWERLAPESTGHAETLAALASVLRSEGQVQDAIDFLDQALRTLESQLARLGGLEETRSNFRADHASYYREYIDLLVSRNKERQAWEVLESSRAQGLSEMLRVAHIDVRKGVDPALLEQERSLAGDIRAKLDRRLRLLGGERTEAQLTAADQEIGRLLKKYNDIEEQIRISSPGYAALSQPQPLSAGAIQRLLRGENILLDYALGKKASYLFAVTSTSLATYRLPGKDSIEALAHQTYECWRAPNKVKIDVGSQTAAQETECPGVAVKLSRILLGPVAQQIRNKRLLIISDGALNYIPFSALPSPEFHDGSSTPLIVEHEVVNLPSASTLALLREQREQRSQAPKAVAVLADPVFDAADQRVRPLLAKEQSRKDRNRAEVQAPAQDMRNDPIQTEDQFQADSLTRSVADLQLESGHRSHRGAFLPRLQFSRQEAKDIAAVTPPGQSLCALDFEANRSTATSPDLAQYRVVHFATHGLLNNRHPELSGLVLSLVKHDGSPQNGFLGLQDIYNLKLQADLVVLSGCETGLGKEIDGEGLIGMTRGFMHAGANRVVASLWSVDDQATAKLMREFYIGMETGKLRPAAALRAAQTEMWKTRRWRSRYYWAAFQMQGDWQ